MHPPTHFDFLIIGQGLAGSLLAYELINKRQSVMVLDNNYQGSSSMVAAGIINPITGHRLNISDNFEQLSPTAISFYQGLEQALKVKVYRGIAQTRLIKNPGQFDFYKKRSAQPGYAELLGSFETNPAEFPNTEIGAVEVNHSSVVNTPRLLEQAQKWLRERGSYRSQKVDYGAFHFAEECIKFDDLLTRKVVFCEGYQAIHNPWLKHLPFKLAKGEIIDVSFAESVIDSMLNWGNWLVPNHENSSDSNTARLGSSFVWNDLSLTPNADRQNKLLASLTEHTNLHASIIETKVGIRPTTMQRKPFVGPIHGLDNAYCFNGFGSKGCLLIPHYAKVLSEHFNSGRELPPYLTEHLTN